MTCAAADRAYKHGLNNHKAKYTRMADNNYSCSVDGHGLKYRGFSVVLMQVFSLDAAHEFFESQELRNMKILTPVENGIDSLIFNIDAKNADNIKRYELPGFDFAMPLERPYPVTLSGHVKVKMSVLFKNTVSLTYRFVFSDSGRLCKASEPVATDHIIALLATHLSAEHWSKNKGMSETDINTEIEDFVISNMQIDESGSYIAKGMTIALNGVGRVFDRISGRYKALIKNNCSKFRKTLSRQQKRALKKEIKRGLCDYTDDFHYAMVDVWEDIMHPVEENGRICDWFDKDRTQRLSEAEVVSHIREMHKPELIGLMTMYPGEWRYRAAEAYDEVCGENIAIDTDDLVLVNNNICYVLGTYGRRGGEENTDDDTVDWVEHLKERERYDVSWPEYLLILEMILVKKYVISYAKDQLINATLGVDKKSSSDLIARNADLSVRLSRIELQLDVVKYSHFMSHKVMFDRTTRRLDLDRDTEILHNMIDLVDNSLHNISDYKAMKSDFALNFILAIISVASTFELFFQKTEMPFLTYSGISSGKFSAIVLWVVAAIAMLGLLLVIKKTIKTIYRKIRNLF